MNEELVYQAERETKEMTIAETVAWLCQQFPGQVVFSTSFSYEDQVITDMILSHQLPVTIFTLDTGRHFEETYKVMSRTNEHYNTLIKAMFPDQSKVEALLAEKGPYSFYHSVENRKECCQIRKVEPLQRALRGASCWITGLRAAQSDARQQLRRFEYDPIHKVIKYNPIVDWSLTQIIDYVKQNHVPYNILHDRGYPSIGCAPCTRPVGPGEDVRAGRWWWENNSSRECGLHESKEK